MPTTALPFRSGYRSGCAEELDGSVKYDIFPEDVLEEVEEAIDECEKCWAEEV
jgi:hypothetical protein